MKTAAETLSPTRVKLTVEVPYDELKPSIDAAYTSIGSQITVPGFRKGKVPARIIDQRVGRGAVLQEAINEAMPNLYGQAVEEAELSPIGQPEVEITAVPLEDSEPLSFTAEVDVRPTITLPDLDSIAVTVDDVLVTDDDITERLDQLRVRFGTLVSVDRPAGAGDFVSIDLSAAIGEETIDEVAGVSYEVGSGNMLIGLDEAVTGLSAGDSTTFNAPLAGGDRAGEDAECSVTVQSVKERQLPDLDDDFAQQASEFDTLDELKAAVAVAAEQTKRFEQGLQARDKILEHLMDTLDVPLPEGIIEHEVNHHLEDEGRLEDAEHRTEVEESTRRALKAQFILDALVEQEDVDVSQQDFVDYLVSQAQQYRMDPNEFAQAIDANNQVPSMVAEVARRKALAGVLDRATITDASGNPVDISQLGLEEDDTEDETSMAMLEVDDLDDRDEVVSGVVVESDENEPASDESDEDLADIAVVEDAAAEGTETEQAAVGDDGDAART